MVWRSLSNATRTARCRRTPPHWAGPVGLLVACVGILLLFALANTGGKFVYTFDDAYIHLAVAENIVHGHYGVNWDEASAPCSSALWPLLLVPFLWVGLHELAPLAVNLVCGLATIAAFSKVVAPAVDGFRPLARHGLATSLVCLLIVATNLVPLIFTGLEHSLQLVCVTSIAAGIAVLAQTGTMPRWATAALVIAPLVRYENLAVSVPALVVLALCSQPRRALVLATAMLALLGSYSVFLTVQGLEALPSSVLLKSHLLRADRAPLAWLSEMAHSLASLQGLRLAAAVLFFACAGWANRANRPMCLSALFGASIALLHLGAGQLDWYGRYGAYAWLACLLVLLTLARSKLKAWLRARPVVVCVALSCATGLLHRRELNNVWEVPLASRNVYEQQYQMHRFVTEEYRAPVAANDIGWLSYENDAYVLDLWGLASPAVRTARTSGAARWMDELTRSRGVKLAMLYGHWFGKLPSSWCVVATLHLGTRPVTVAGDTVTFYATDPNAAPRLSQLLMGFRPKLPPRVRLVLTEEASTRGPSSADSTAIAHWELAEHLAQLNAPVRRSRTESLPRRLFVQHAE